MLVLSLYELKIAHISLSICVFAYSPVSFDHMKYILFTLYFSIESSYNPLLMLWRKKKNVLCTFSHLQEFLVKVHPRLWLSGHWNKWEPWRFRFKFSGDKKTLGDFFLFVQVSVDRVTLYLLLVGDDMYLVELIEVHTSWSGQHDY